VTASRDGSVRVIIAAVDPGDGNWLDTAGHAHGFVLFRWLLADECALPTGEVVPSPAACTRREPDAADD
jgi:hypothetical protein